MICSPAPISANPLAPSSNVTLWPASAQDIAAERPPSPAPMTMTFKGVSIAGICRCGRIWGHLVFCTRTTFSKAFLPRVHGISHPLKFITTRISLPVYKIRAAPPSGSNPKVGGGGSESGERPERNDLECHCHPHTWELKTSASVRLRWALNWSSSPGPVTMFILIRLQTSCLRYR